MIRLGILLYIRQNTEKRQQTGYGHSYLSEPESLAIIKGGRGLTWSGEVGSAGMHGAN